MQISYRKFYLEYLKQFKEPHNENCAAESLCLHIDFKWHQFLCFSQRMQTMVKKLVFCLI